MDNYLETTEAQYSNVSYPQAYDHLFFEKNNKNKGLGKIPTNFSFLILTKELI